MYLSLLIRYQEFQSIHGWIIDLRCRDRREIVKPKSLRDRTQKGEQTKVEPDQIMTVCLNREVTKLAVNLIYPVAASYVPVRMGCIARVNQSHQLRFFPDMSPQQDMS